MPFDWSFPIYATPTRIEDPIPAVNSGYTITDNTVERAANLCCVLVAPQPHQLQIDIDSNDAFTVYRTRLKMLRENFPYLNFTEEIHPSRSGLSGKYHATLTFSNKIFDPTERCAWQMMLGSDPVREALSMFGVIAGHTTPSCLFESSSTRSAPQFSTVAWFDECREVAF